MVVVIAKEDREEDHAFARQFTYSHPRHAVAGDLHVLHAQVVERLRRSLQHREKAFPRDGDLLTEGKRLFPCAPAARKSSIQILHDGIKAAVIVCRCREAVQPLRHLIKGHFFSQQHPCADIEIMYMLNQIIGARELIRTCLCAVAPQIGFKPCRFHRNIAKRHTVLRICNFVIWNNLILTGIAHIRAPPERPFGVPLQIPRIFSRLTQSHVV